MNKLFKSLIIGTLALSCVSPIAMGAEDNKVVAAKEEKTDDSYSFGNCFKNSTMVKVTTGTAVVGLLGNIGFGVKFLGLI